MEAVVESIFAGRPKTLRDERGEWTSSIWRERVEGPIEVLRDGLNGDRVTQPYHGGPDSALCVHLHDHYDFWNRRLGLNLRAGQVGENFTLAGIREEQVCAGDVVRVGSALIQVSGPRVPCANLARRIGRTDWLKLTIAENRTGFYARVLEPGWVQAGDGWELREQRHKGATISAINRCGYLEFDRGLAKSLVEMSGLGAWWREQFREKLASRGDHWTEKLGQ